MNKIFTPALIILLLIIINVLRFHRLDEIPYGFHVDEYSAAVTARCFALEGTDAWGVKNRTPFFTVAYGSPRPATYIYPLAWIGKVFGYTVPVLRAFSALAVLLGIAGIFALGWRMAGLSGGLWAALAASLSPPIFVMSRFGIESLFAASFFAWALYFLLKPQNKIGMAAAGIFTALSAYSYPPARAFIPLFLVVFFIIYHPWRAGLWSWVIFILVAAILSIPLAHSLLTDEMVSRRFNQISILGDLKDSPWSWGWIKEVLTSFIHNMGLHLSWDFLFKRGDGSLIHSTGKHGLFSWVDYAAWAGALGLYGWQLLRRGSRDFLNDKGKIVLLCVAGFFLSIVPSALTNSEIPNASRVSLYWPLVSLLTGVLISEVQRQHPWSAGAFLAVAVVFASLFLRYYFKEYPERSKGMFSYWVLADARQIKNDQDMLKFLVKYRFLDFHSRYYLMNQEDVSCQSSYQIWEHLYRKLGGGKRY